MKVRLITTILCDWQDDVLEHCWIVERDIDPLPQEGTRTVIDGKLLDVTDVTFEDDITRVFLQPWTEVKTPAELRLQEGILRSLGWRPAD